MRWILDDGPFGTLAAVRPRSLTLLTAEVLVVAPSTADAASSSRERTEMLALQNPEGERVIRSFEILLGASDPAEPIFLDLHPDETTAVNQAERQAIAWALTHAPDAVFVTEDKRAALTALAELGRERVAHPFDLWIELARHDAVTAEELRDLCRRTQQKDQGLSRVPGRVATFLDR